MLRLNTLVFLNRPFEGIFRESMIGWSWAFYLETDNGLVQLIFYCGTLQTTSSFQGKGIDAGMMTQISKNIRVKQYSSYCANPSEVPIQPGTLLHVRGTLITPTMWPNSSLQFIGDLYVFEYCLGDICVAT
jgi:hypothetical protein